MTASEPTRVLCLEDDAGLARLLQKRLERSGYRVDLAADGEEGLSMYDHERHDILVVDQMMPVHTGLEVMQVLSERGSLPPMIMVTGTGNEEVAVEAMKLGAGDYLVKDVDAGYLELLPTVIEQVLEQQRMAEEKRRNQEALRRYAAELEARNQELDAFAHTVAHDLKNPLNQIGGYAHLLRDACSEQLDVMGCECVEGITLAVETMASIIDALLLLASVRQQEVLREPLDMADVVEEAMRRLAPMIEDSQAEVAVPASGWPEALGYGPWVEEIWVNYISNAVKYGGRRDEGMPPRVELGFDRDVRNPRFWVRDNGPGLTEDEVTRLFTPFTRLHQTHAEGHGLGLSIVRRIVTKLGGEVDVESDPGCGSTFSFTLPPSD